MVAKRAIIDENGLPPRMPIAPTHVKEKKGRGSAPLLDEIAGKLGENGPTPMPQLNLSLDLKKPRDFAISLLQQENVDLQPFSRHQELLTLVDNLKEKTFFPTSSERTSTQQEGPRQEPEWPSRPFVIQGRFKLPSLESSNTAAEEQVPQTRRLDSEYEPYHPGDTPIERQAVYCHLKLVQWATDKVPDVPQDVWDSSDEDSADSLEDDLSEDEDQEPRLVLMVTNPDPDPNPASRFFFKSAAYNASSADQWAHSHLSRARSNFLERYVYAQRKINPHAPWMPSPFNPVRREAPPEAWSLLEAPLIFRLRDSQWRMKTPLGEGVLKRASRLLCDNDGNDPRHCLCCKYDNLLNQVLSISFRRQRAAQGMFYSYDSCRTCFGRLNTDADVPGMGLGGGSSTLSDEPSYDSTLPPRPSVDPDKLWAEPLIQGIELNILEDGDEDEEEDEEDPSIILARDDVGYTGAKDDDYCQVNLRPLASPVDENSDSSSDDDRSREEVTDVSQETLAAESRTVEPCVFDDETYSDGDGVPPRLNRSLSRLNKRRRYSSPELIAPSWDESSLLSNNAKQREGSEVVKEKRKGKSREEEKEEGVISMGHSQKRRR